MSNRRIPQQQRSRQKYELVLDAASNLVEADGHEALTAATVISTAGVATGTFYAYFDDVEAVIDALVDRHLERFVEVVQHAFESNPPDSIGDASDALIDAFADYHRLEPSFRILWYGGGLRAHHVTADETSDQRLTLLCAELGRKAGLADEITPETLLELRLSWLIGDVLLREAFRNDPIGDDYIIAEAKRTIRLRMAPFTAPSRSENNIQ